MQKNAFPSTHTNKVPARPRILPLLPARPLTALAAFLSPSGPPGARRTRSCQGKPAELSKCERGSDQTTHQAAPLHVIVAAPGYSTILGEGGNDLFFGGNKATTDDRRSNAAVRTKSSRRRSYSLRRRTPRPPTRCELLAPAKLQEVMVLPRLSDPYLKAARMHPTWVRVVGEQCHRQTPTCVLLRRGISLRIRGQPGDDSLEGVRPERRREHQSARPGRRQ